MKPPMAFGSLFAGIGGFDLGFERAGLTCQWQVEIDPFCQKVLAKHWPDVRRHDDVRTFPPTEGDWSVDVICGGFPCQDISSAGKQAGIDGERSGLWREYIRIVRQIRPRYVVVENVAALLVRGIDQVLGDLAASGYDAEWDCLPASAFGLPHSRERVWLVAYRDQARELQSQRMFTQERRRFSNRRQAIDWILSSGGIFRSHDGIPAGLDRVGALGNAVVPQVAEWIGRRLIEADQS